jgi:hypothetical protein
LRRNRIHRMTCHILRLLKMICDVPKASPFEVRIQQMLA